MAGSADVGFRVGKRPLSRLSRFTKTGTEHPSSGIQAEVGGPVSGLEINTLTIAHLFGRRFLITPLFSSKAVDQVRLLQQGKKIEQEKGTRYPNLKDVLETGGGNKRVDVLAGHTAFEIPDVQVFDIVDAPPQPPLRRNLCKNDQY